MSATVDPDLVMKLGKFGVADATACFNCGNCAALCSLSTEGVPFPRKVLRYLQLGLSDKLLQSPEPWLCYYCGDCSETCPRQANPGEVMMGLRRYLTARYDWTGISRRFYTSTRFEVLAILLVAALVGLGFYFFHGPIVTDRVALNVFAPNTVVEALNLILLAVLLVCVACIKERKINEATDLVEGAQTTAAGALNIEAMESKAVFTY
jgi:ferredoxin